MGRGWRVGGGKGGSYSLDIAFGWCCDSIDGQSRSCVFVADVTHILIHGLWGCTPQPGRANYMCVF